MNIETPKNASLPAITTGSSKATSKTTSDTPVPGSRANPEYITVNGNKLYKRNCFKAGPHEPHSQLTYYYDPTPRTGDPDNAWCDGSGEKPYIEPYSYAGYSTVKKDYSDDEENFPFSNPITIAQARKIAHHMHRNQKDKTGHPYSEHLNAVEAGVKVLGGSSEERIAALFHDAIEDHHTTADILRKINVTENTINIIKAVSKASGEEQNVYLARIIKEGLGACRVKASDIMHNIRHDRIAEVRKMKGDSTADRLLKKYRPALARLLLELEMIVDEDEQKKLATKPIGSSTSSYTTNYSGGPKGKHWDTKLGKYVDNGPEVTKEEKYKNSPKPEKPGDPGFYDVHTWDFKTKAYVVNEEKMIKYGWQKPESTGKTPVFEAEIVNLPPRTACFEVESLFRGDWPLDWSAPILDREAWGGVAVFTLANGEVREETYVDADDAPIWITFYEFSEWTTNEDIVFDGVTNDDFADFIEAIESRSTKTGNLTFPEEDNELSDAQWEAINEHQAIMGKHNKPVNEGIEEVLAEERDAGTEAGL